MRRLLFLGIAFTLNSCFTPESNIEPLASYPDSLSTFSKDLPTIDFEYTATRDREKMLSLDSLNNGFTNLQIRIWYDYSRGNKRKLIQIINSGQTWTAKVYNFTVDWNKDKEVLLANDTVTVVPKTGWNSFFRKLVELKIFTLPDMSKIPNLEDNWKDGHSYHIEIASKNQYRFYSYHVPEEFSEFWQAQNVIKMVELFAVELNVVK